MPFQLRDYQQSLIDRCFQSLDQGETPLLVAPTGAGKTVVLAEIARRLIKNGDRTFITAHRIEIVQQICAAIKSHTGIEPGLLISGSRAAFEDHRVVVGMVPTIVRRLDSLPSGWCLLEDEAHHSIASSWKKLRDALKPVRRIGLTATPITPSGGGLGPAGFTALHEGPALGWLIGNEHLSKFRYYAAPPGQSIKTAGVKTVRGDYDQKELSSSIDGQKLAADAVDLFRRYCPDEPRTIAACLSREHARLVTDQFQGAGIAAEYLDGSMNLSQRQEVMADFRSGAVKVICQVAVLDEGTDIPDATALLLLRPTRSVRLYRQLVGRVLRTAPGKTEALVIDAGQAYLDCGLPDSPIEWTLDGLRESPPRATIANEDGQVIEHPQAELILAEKLRLEEISREQAERGRLQRGRENFATICSMARHDKVPKGAVYASLQKQPRSRNEFAMAAHTLGRSQEWAIAGWDKQNSALLEKGLEAAPIRWPELEVEPVAAGATVAEVWAAAVKRCQQPGNRRLLSQHFKLAKLTDTSATIQVDLNWAAWGRKHHEQISSVLCGAAGKDLQVELNINPG